MDPGTEITPDSTFGLIVIGGGVAGVTCVETLSSYCEEDKILLLTASPVVKAVTNYTQLSEIQECFDVEEKPACYLEDRHPNVKVIQDVVLTLDTEQHLLKTATGKLYQYKKLCICSGGKPKVISDNEYVSCIRDTESVAQLQSRLKHAKRIVLVGNGGIATELVYKVCDVELIWCIKDKSISAAFVDAGAAEFFLPLLNDQETSVANARTAQNKPKKRLQYVNSAASSNTSIVESDHKPLGEALGPDWHEGLSLVGSSQQTRSVCVEYEVEIDRVMNPDEWCRSPFFNTNADCTTESSKWPVYVSLSNGTCYGCDVVISATGVITNTQMLGLMHKFDLCKDGGLLVDDKMRTSVSDVYSAGDVCTAGWQTAKHWHQMRLWTQARQMGHYAAKSMYADMSGEELMMDICFDLFAHTTSFFGYKVVLLGLFNAQTLGTNYELLLRVTNGEEYVKVVLQDGRMMGAILIGETDLEETFEHLILNETDLSRYGEDLLDPNIDIEDYFD